MAGLPASPPSSAAVGDSNGDSGGDGCGGGVVSLRGLCGGADSNAAVGGPRSVTSQLSDDGGCGAEPGSPFNVSDWSLRSELRLRMGCDARLTLLRRLLPAVSTLLLSLCLFSSIASWWSSVLPAATVEPLPGTAASTVSTGVAAPLLLLVDRDGALAPSYPLAPRRSPSSRFSFSDSACIAASTSVRAAVGRRSVAWGLDSCGVPSRCELAAPPRRCSAADTVAAAADAWHAGLADGTKGVGRRLAALRD